MEYLLCNYKSSFMSTNETAFVATYISNGSRLSHDLHVLYRTLSDSKKKGRKSHKKVTRRNTKLKQKVISSSNSSNISAVQPFIELLGNPSSFTVYAQVRSLVLENLRLRSQDIFLRTTLPDSVDSDSELDDEKGTDVRVPQVPKVVGMGLVTVFELIRGSVSAYPALCISVLEALLDILQAQQLEALSNESSHVIDSMFDILLRVATTDAGDALNDSSSPLVGVACTCLVSLVLARGETGKYLRTITDILMSNRHLASQNIKVPLILTQLQRSVHAVLLGKKSRPDWLNYGVPESSLVEKFIVESSTGIAVDLPGSLTSDGPYLYLHNGTGLYKIGSGFGGTNNGHVYLHRPNFFPAENGWLGFANDLLLFRLKNDSGEFMILDRELLKVINTVECIEKDWQRGLTFCDQSGIGIIIPDKEDGFVIRLYNPQVKPMVLANEVNIGLAKKCFQVFGILEGQLNLNMSFEGDLTSVCAGKEFVLVRTSTGKVHFHGKGSALGMKHGAFHALGIPNTNSHRASVSYKGPLPNNTGAKWPELPITKSPRIVHIAVGHEGFHSVLVSDDGTVFFTGISKRGEDGDYSKVRKQPKAMKPKKILKMDGHFVVNAACNNGTTALVTRDGELYMFGKDNFSCDPSCGLVAVLKDVHVTNAALGKAHVIALTDKGHIYSFGINNKGQCGRDYSQHSRYGVPESSLMSVGGMAEEECEDDEGNESTEEGIEWTVCAAGQHRWHRDHCMVCTICYECTGYGSSCVSSGRPNRKPSMPCGCGAGDSGCSECGCCRACADEVDVDRDGMALMNVPLFGMEPEVVNVGANVIGNVGPKVQNKFLPRVDKRYNQREITVEKAGSLSKKMSAVNYNGDHEKDASKTVAVPPARINLPTISPVVQISCGLQHSLALCANGEVYSWGSNSHGQLGTGDLVSHGYPTRVVVPPTAKVTQIAGGGNHSVLLSSVGQVYTFGNYQKGQLGREAPLSDTGEGSSKGMFIWHATPGTVLGIGPRLGKRASWIGASADSTFIKLDQSMISSYDFQSSCVIANHNCLVLFPVKRKMRRADENWRSLAINRSEGSCKSFFDSSQHDFDGEAVCLDPIYNVIWSYNSSSQIMKCFNVIATNGRRCPSLSICEGGMKDVFSPGLSLPVAPHASVSRAQVALHMLACMDSLNWANESGLSVEKDNVHIASTPRAYTKDDFAPVNRFESHGGGWGYSGHSIEAIRFMCDADIFIGGFGLFGGRGEYLAKIKIFDLGLDGGDQESDGDLLFETEETPYECGARQKFAMLFEEPVPIQANRWYVAWARVSGPSSDCGSSGQSMITTEDQVVFYFKSSKKSNNGTDVNAGQIPQILYRLQSSESNVPVNLSANDESVSIPSNRFNISVTNDAFQALLDLLTWSWTTLCNFYAEERPGPLEANRGVNLERLVYICCSCLRLLRIFIWEIYPNSAKTKRYNVEKECLAESVASVRSFLQQMLSEPLLFFKSSPSRHSPKVKNVSSKDELKLSLEAFFVLILDECHNTFVSCFHAFYPTGQLKWSSLCNLLLSRDQGGENCHANDRLLSAVLVSLCTPTVKLRVTCPILNESDSECAQKPSPADNAALSTLQPGDLLKYPLLVERMSSKVQIGNDVGMMWTFREVLDRLLGVVCSGVRQSLRGERPVSLPSLVHNTCLFMSSVVAELCAESASTQNDIPAGGRVQYITPCRFTRMSQSRTWSTGNGSPDAICFSVDRHGIVVSGVCVYGGTGAYDYEIELLEETGSSDQDSLHSLERWNVVETIRGTFGPDDSVMDIVELRFERPVSVKEGAKYAIRLINRGGRTSNGDGGLACVKGTDGTTFTFSACSLSVNGTSQIRGQIPQIIYYSTSMNPENQESTKEVAESQAKKSALTMVGAIFRAATELVMMGLGVGDEAAVQTLATAPIISMLLPLLLAHIKPVAVSDPRGAVAITTLIQEVLPHVSALNNLSLVTRKPSVPDNIKESNTTSSHHYAWVDCDHPYKPCTVSNQRLKFPSSVQWVSLEFDPRCGTAQPEDALQIYIPSVSSDSNASKAVNVEELEENFDPNFSRYWPVLGKLSGSKNWPQQTIVLPGNELVFSFETASYYMKEEKSNTYGFRILAIGFEWTPNSFNSLHHLEKELSYLGGHCAASLITSSLVLPPIPGEETEQDIATVDEAAMQVYALHPSLLSKGFALSHPPTIQQALDGVIPFSCHSNERLFLRDFVSCTLGSSGGRMARWLQPDSYVDIRACEVLYSRDDMRAGWPAIVTIITKDQYNEKVHVPRMKVEIFAVPVSVGDESIKGKVRRFSQHVPDSLSFGGHAQPNLDVPYQVSIKDKMCYNAISVMKAYDNYSFEELRYVSPAVRRPTENMLVRNNGDGSYSCNWTPSCTGWYSLKIRIDGYSLEKVYKLEVKEPPLGMINPVQNPIKKTSQRSSRLRKFVLQNSSGLRIRIHPSLQSEQIGIIHKHETIAFVNEVHNSDGVWLRLSLESIRQFCSDSAVTEAWCLQYNQHLGKTLLIPVDHPKTIFDQVINDTISGRGTHGPSVAKSGRRLEAERVKVFSVVKCGASGHNIRSRPSMKAPPVGMLVIGNTINVDSETKNNEGTWVRLDSECTRKYCFSDGEAWSLATSKGHTLYLQCSQNTGETLSRENGIGTNCEQSGFDFTQFQMNPFFKSFGSSGAEQKTPFVFGSEPPTRDRCADSESKTSDMSLNQKQNSVMTDSLGSSLKPEYNDCSEKSSGNKATSSIEAHSDRESIFEDPNLIHLKDIPPELHGVSVKELVKAIGESRVNGNGVTPPRTPPATPKRVSRSSSPGVLSGASLHSSRGSSPVYIRGVGRASKPTGMPHQGTSRGLSPLIGNEENGCVSKSPKSDRLSVSGFTESSGDECPSASSMPSHVPRSANPSRRRHPNSSNAYEKSVTQTSTQTSPDGVKFSIGSASSKEDVVPLSSSPKILRKERTAKGLRQKRDRPVSPGTLQREKPLLHKGEVKMAMSPSVAECLRAVFAAFLWHEGIVHDAMACASYIKFHPDLTKKGTTPWKPFEITPTEERNKLTKEQKARQRHSVEVSAHSYLNVLVSNTDELQRLNLNANVTKEETVDQVTVSSTSSSDLVQSSSQICKLATVIEGGGVPANQESSELPLVLKNVVILWDELTACIRTAIEQQVFLLPSSSLLMSQNKAEKIEKSDKEKKRSRKKYSGSPKHQNIDAGCDDASEEIGGVCELCGQMVSQHASEQHFSGNHPGCGSASHGCGYVGTRWKFFPSKDRLPLPCGEVFRGCFHMCWGCRKKYKENNSLIPRKKVSSTKKSKKKISAKILSPLPDVEAHIIMRNNSMFLLDLASAASSSISSRSQVVKGLSSSLPYVSQMNHSDSNPFAKVAFQCLHTLNCQQQHLNQLKEDHLLHHHPNVHSSDNTTATTAATTSNGGCSSSGESKENFPEGDSFSSGHSHQESPASDPEISWRPFHRSVSVTVGPSGQDWCSSAASVSGTLAPTQDEKTGRPGVVMRKRNNSSSENNPFGTGSILAHPSVALEKIASQIKVGTPSVPQEESLPSLALRPVMSFIFQSYDLENLAFAMRHATRKAATRVYGMQALNWLLQSVTQPTCLHDLLWCFVKSLTPSSSSQLAAGLDQAIQFNAVADDELANDLDGEIVVLQHPMNDVTLSGDAVQPLPQTFHQLLQTIANLMMLLPPGSPLQMMAVRCWSLRFSSSDHEFLHQSHVFSNISKILSRSEEVLGGADEGAALANNMDPATGEIESMVDLTAECEVSVSSRQAMVSSLTDMSTETFWESGDEDRNKAKIISVVCPPRVYPRAFYIHVDNCRDLGNKILSVTFKTGSSLEDLVLIQEFNVETRYGGWIHTYGFQKVDYKKKVLFTAELRGPDQSVRVRQIRVLGFASAVREFVPQSTWSPFTLQQRACEQETLKVFRLITDQVFDRVLKKGLQYEECELTEGAANPDAESLSRSTQEVPQGDRHNNDLREHMVGILFSRSKLSHLQKQVCTHIVQAIKKESKRSREEWDSNPIRVNPTTLTPHEPSQHLSLDAYCFEMLSMVLALSGSPVGRAHLANQDNLLKHLLSLLHTGSARVQRQVVSLFRRMFIDIAPLTLAHVLPLTKLPSVDLTAIQIQSPQDAERRFNPHKNGILDVFLSVIAKALVVQVKTKMNDLNEAAKSSDTASSKIGISSVSMSQCVSAGDPRWWIRGCSSKSIADLIINLIRDMTHGKFTDDWAQVSKSAIAENIVNLTRLNEEDRSDTNSCLSLPTLWLSLASLCVLHPEHIETLSSQQWRTLPKDNSAQPHFKPMCENHDDGATAAMIACETCGNLCGDCDRILHLPKRARSHHRTVFREEQQAIKVDLHEGCGRVKLFWLLALADSTTLKAMLELRSENGHRSRNPVPNLSSCRFCGSHAQPNLISLFPVCNEDDCQEYNKEACQQTLDCGHICGGIKDEKECLPCLVGCSANALLKQDADDMCMICFSEPLAAAPCLQLECGHLFHFHCCRSVLLKKWPGPRITFTFSQCPICKLPLKNWALSEMLQPINVLYDDVRRKALMRLEYEGLAKAEVSSSATAKFQSDPVAFAMHRYAYYVCYKCSKAYYGGEARCENELAQSDDFDPEELVCGACSDVSSAQMCPKHGTDFLEYKCRYCCSVAVFFCFGTTHFCNACHEDFQRVTNISKADLPRCPAGARAMQLVGDECPLHVQHPPTGEEFALGCGVCRNAHSF